MYFLWTMPEACPVGTIVEGPNFEYLLFHMMNYYMTKIIIKW